jgi:GxxExxY protein
LPVIVKNQYTARKTTGNVIGAAMGVHRNLGPGFLESVYEEALSVELKLKQIQFERQKELPFFYRNRVIKKFICDFFVEGKVIVELKAAKELGEIDAVQVISYLKASGVETGLLINFGSKSLQYKRLINSKSKNQEESA